MEASVNICIVGRDEKYLKYLATSIAQNLHLPCVDAKAEFNSFLIKSVHYPTAVVEDFLEKQESKLLKLFSKTENVVIYVPDDMYLSNNNYKLFKNNVTVSIIDENVDEIQSKIQNLLKSLTKLSFNTNTELKTILDKLKEYV